MLRDITIDLMYQSSIDGPPPHMGDLYRNAAAGDKTTIDSWRNIWVENYKKAKDHFGNLAELSFAKFYAYNRQKPCIIVGSGPSLKTSLPALKANSEREFPVTTISCLHNFGLLEDEGFHADFYLTLDSGGVVLDDVFESRDKEPDHYWEASKGKVLLAYASSDPKLWEKWQGEVYLFNALVPDFGIMEAKKQVEPFTHYISSGGNALGACFYTAKALMCADPIIFVGADFCFDYDNTFHSYKTKYDKVGNYVVWPDVYGLPRKTWQSYLNFKYWFDDRAVNIPGNYISCSDGLLGAYREGNIKQFQYKTLEQALVPYESHEVLHLEQRDVKTGKANGKAPFNVKEYWQNTCYEHDVTFF